MALVFNTKTYTADSFAADQIGYYGALQTITSRDYLYMRRTLAKPIATSSGVAKVSAKLARTFTLTNAVEKVRDGYVEVPVSIPVGAASADVDAILNDMAALLGSANFKTFVKSQVLAF